MIKSQQRLLRLIKIEKHELTKAIKDHVDWRKKHETNANTLNNILGFYSKFRKFIYGLDQHEFLLNNAGIGKTYIAYLHQDGLANSTIKTHFRAFQSIINGLQIFHNFQTKELFRDFAKPHKENEDYFMTEEEVKQLLSTSYPKKKDWIKEMVLQRFLLACFTGCRVSEIDTIEIKNDTTIAYIAYKTKKQVLVPLAKSIKHILIEDNWKSTHNLVMQNCNRTLHKIFKDLKWNEPVKKYIIKGKVKTVYKVPRWKAITFHSGRKWYGKMLLDMDVPMYKVSKLLGHSNIQTTQNYYAAIDKEKMIEEVNEKLNNF